MFAFGYDNSTELLPITIGKKYIVSAVEVNRYGSFYLIVADDSEIDCTPWFYPSSFFGVIDSSSTNEWSKKEIKNYSIEGFKKIVDDDVFYQDLLDGNKVALKIYSLVYSEYASFHNIEYVDHKT